MHYVKYKVGSYSTSNVELYELTVACLFISLAFAFFLPKYQILNYDFYTIFFISAITVGFAFVLHELGHKFTAQCFGCFAEFRASFFMLFVALMLAIFTPFLFIAPGAVMISGHINNVTNGKISASGPLVNILLAALFFILFTVFPNVNELMSLIFSFGFKINSWLAFFNLLPIGILDGRKVLLWNKNVYGGMMIIAVIFSFFGGV